MHRQMERAEARSPLARFLLVSYPTLASFLLRPKKTMHPPAMAARKSR